MHSPSTLDRFKVSKEELTKLGSEFNSEALPLIKKLYNTSFWILLNNKFAKKIVLQTFIEAIENCNVTKNSAEWQSWIFRIWIREILDFYSRRENDTQTMFYFIDHAELDSKDVVSITKLNKINSGKSEDELIKLLQKLPSVLRMSTIMKEIHLFHYEKIAELLDVPVGVIASRIYRARKLLFLSLSESFHFEEEKRKWKQKDSTKLIFELRNCASFVDDELTSEQKSEFIESTKNNDQYENEILIQAEMKKIFKNCSIADSLIVPIQSKIKRKARQKFN